VQAVILAQAAAALTTLPPRLAVQVETHVFRLAVVTAETVVTKLVPAVLAVLEQAVLEQAVTVQAAVLTVAQL